MDQRSSSDPMASNGHIKLPGTVVNTAEQEDGFTHAVGAVFDIFKRAAYCAVQRRKSYRVLADNYHGSR